MADAKKCDVCGALYDFDLYSYYEIFKIIHPFPSMKLDLCPKCKKKLTSFLDNDENKTKPNPHKLIRTMTLSEIEKMCGYEIQLISEDSKCVFLKP